MDVCYSCNPYTGIRALHTNKKPIRQSLPICPWLCGRRGFREVTEECHVTVQKPTLEQRKLWRGSTALESQPVASTRREQAHGPTFPKTEREREDITRQVGQLLQRERGEGLGGGGRRRAGRKGRKG
jgi:hypothetical protein